MTGYKKADDLDLVIRFFLFCASLLFTLSRFVTGWRKHHPADSKPLQAMPAVPRDNFAPPVRLKFYRGKYSPNPFGRYAPNIYISDFIIYWKSKRDRWPERISPVLLSVGRYLFLIFRQKISFSDVIYSR